MAARGPSRVHAFHVETGEATELEWPLGSDALRWSIVLSGDGTRLDPSGPVPQGPLYIYSRKTLEADTPEPAPLVIEVEEAAEPALPPRAEPHTNPMLAAYQAFEYQFTLHAAKARALREAIEKRREASGKLAAEAEAQLRGMRAAQSNVEATHRELLGEYGVFRETFTARHAAHGALLASFEEDMRRLLQARLHPALATPQRQTLLDCIPEARFRSWADTCRQEHEQLQARVVELDALMRDLRESVESDAQRNVVDVEPLRRMQVRSGETVRTAAAQSEVLERDLEAIRTTLRTSLAALQAARAFNWASCDGFSTMQKAHETQLLELSDANRLSKDTLAFFAQTKNRLRREVWHRLRSVAGLQNRVRDAHNRLAVFRQALQRQSSACDQLLTLHEMPAAYFASLDEVHRRQRFARNLNGALERVSGRLDAARDGEISRREAFLERHGRFILKDLVPGLDEPLPSFQLAAPRFDTALPHLGPPPAHVDAEEGGGPLLLEPPSVRQAEAEASALRQRVRELEERARALAATAGGVHASSTAGLRHEKSGEEALAKAEKQREEYVARIGALEAKLSRMYELNSQLQTRLSDTETLAASHPPEADSPQLRQRLMEAEATAAQLKARAQQAEEANKELRARNGELSEQLKAKSQQAEDSAAQLQAQRERSSTLQKEVQTVQLDMAQANSNAEARLAQANAAAEARIAQANSAAEARIAQANSVAEARIAAVQRDAEEAAARVAARCNKLETDLAAQQQRAEEALKAASSGRSKREEEAAEALEEAREQLKAVQAVLKEEEAARAAQVKELSAKLAAVERAAKEAEERSSKRGEEGSALRQQAQKAQQEAERNQQELQRSQQELQALRTQLTDAARKLAVAEEAAATQRAKLAEQEKAAGEARARLDGAEKSAAESRTRAEQAEQNAAAMRARLEVAERSVADAKGLCGAVNSAVASARISVPRPANANATEVQLAGIAFGHFAAEYAERVKQEEAARRRLETTAAALAEAEGRVAELSKKVEELSSQVLVRTLELQDLKSQAPRPVGAPASPVAAKRDRESIALRDFEVGDIVMFWSNAQHVYEAYTYVRGGGRAPKYFLSEDSFPSFEKERTASLVIMGTVVSREQLKATGSDYTRLPAGEVYHELIIQRLD